MLWWKLEDEWVSADGVVEKDAAGVHRQFDQAAREAFDARRRLQLGVPKVSSLTTQVVRLDSWVWGTLLVL